MNSQLKIVSKAQAIEIVKKWHQEGLKIVFTNGCFDILHLGHVDYLEKASNLAEKLIVGLNTDASVSRIKGPSRPVQDELSRSRLMAALGFVDLIVLFDEETPAQLIETLKPDVLVKGKDYEVSNIIGADIVIKNGGKVETIELVSGYSTSNIIKKINSNK